MPLGAADRELLDDLRERLGAELGLAAMVPFGPRLRGDDQADLDLCLVFLTVDPQLREQVEQLAWEVGFDYGITVCPLLVTTSEWIAAETPLLARLRRNEEDAG